MAKYLWYSCMYALPTFQTNDGNHSHDPANKSYYWLVVSHQILFPLANSWRDLLVLCKHASVVASWIASRKSLVAATTASQLVFYAPILQKMLISVRWMNRKNHCSPLWLTHFPIRYQQLLLMQPFHLRL